MEEVKSVGARGEVWIEAKQGPATFHLRLIDNNAKQWAATLTRGTPIRFDGAIGEERSFSDSGAVSNPEFNFWPTAIGSAAGDAIHSQDQKLIDEAIAAYKQEVFDSLASSALAVACERAIKNKLKPTPVDFSWKHTATGRLEGEKWGYRNFFEVPNAYGGKVTMEALCTATITADANNNPAITNLQVGAQ